MDPGTLKVTVDKWTRLYYDDDDETHEPEAWVNQLEITASDKKVIAATLRGMADTLDPPKTTY